MTALGWHRGPQKIAGGSSPGYVTRLAAFSKRQLLRDATRSPQPCVPLPEGREGARRRTSQAASRARPLGGGGKGALLGRRRVEGLAAVEGKVNRAVGGAGRGSSSHKPVEAGGPPVRSGGFLLDTDGPRAGRARPEVLGWAAMLGADAGGGQRQAPECAPPWRRVGGPRRALGAGDYGAPRQRKVCRARAQAGAGPGWGAIADGAQGDLLDQTGATLHPLQRAPAVRGGSTNPGGPLPASSFTSEGWGPRRPGRTLHATGKNLAWVYEKGLGRPGDERFSLLDETGPHPAPPGAPDHTDWCGAY